MIYYDVRYDRADGTATFVGDRTESGFGPSLWRFTDDDGRSGRSYTYPEVECRVD
jgi:hypothetical protein